MDKVKAVKEIASMIWATSINLQMQREGKNLRFLPKDFWGQELINKTPYLDTATQICQLRPKVKLPKAREYNYIVDRCISVEGVFRAGEEYILQQVKELNDMEVEK